MSDEPEVTSQPPDAPPKKKRKKDPLIGKVLADRFKVEKLVAKGGMGCIYQATQAPLDRIIALKTLHAGTESDVEEFRTRFFNEASICAKLTHPNTVRIFDYGVTWDDVYFIAMEWLEGKPYHDLIKDEGPLHPLRVSHIAKQICGSLAEAHDQGVIHRDMKPANVLICQHGEDMDYAKVVDFGLVKQVDEDSQVTKAGTVLGSPMYMSPEQVEGTSDVDARTDIYALGVVMYVALTGQVPFARKTSMAVMMSHMSAPVPPFAEIAPDVEIPASYEWIVMRCMEKGREDRFSTMQGLSRALRVAEMDVREELPDDFQWTMENGELALPEMLQELFQTGQHAAAGGGTAIPHYMSSPTLKKPKPASVEPEPEHGSRAGLFVALGVGALMLFAVLGIGGTVVLGMLSEGEPEVVEAPIEEAPPVELVIHGMTVKSNPSGAEVSHDGVLLGNTPLPLKIPDGEKWALTIHAKGFDDRSVVVDGSMPELMLSLEEKEAKTVAPVDHTKKAVADPVTPTEPEKKKQTGEIRNPWAD